MKRIIFLVLFLCSVALADNPYRSFVNFNAGELYLLDGREDLAKYQSGLSIMENAIPIPQGGAEKRPGTKYIATVKTSSLKTRLFPFEFSTTQSYAIEVGNQYKRFFTSSAVVFAAFGTQDLSAYGPSGDNSLIAQWKMDDNAANDQVSQNGRFWDITAMSVAGGAGADTITVQPGSDLSGIFSANSLIWIDGQGVHDGRLGVASASWSSPNLTITVDEDLTDGTVQGTLAPHAGDVSAGTTAAFSVADFEGTANSAFDMSGVSDEFEVEDSTDFTFGDGTDDNPFTVAAWIKTASDLRGGIVTKWDNVNNEEWAFQSARGTDGTNGFIELSLYDESASSAQVRESTIKITTGQWYFVVATYDGRGGNLAADGIKIYIDGADVSGRTTYGASYVAMEDKAADVFVSDTDAGGEAGFQATIDNAAIWNKQLSATEISTLFGSATATPYEIATPYLTADLFSLKTEQSADVLYITHPDYETRKLSRIANNVWTLGVAGYNNGPFRVQNRDTFSTISATEISGGGILKGASVTLTAVGGVPFIDGTTAGHEPSGNTVTDKSNTGALFRLIHPIENLSFSDTLEDDVGASSAEGVSWMACGTLFKGATWSWVTGGTWLGEVAVQRNYTIGAAFADSGWETVLPFEGVTTARNVSETGTENDGDADYRVAFLDDTSGTVISYFSTDQTEVVGIVQITSVTSTSVAIGTVIKSLGGASADKTYKWSEGSWSNYRGWPGTVAFFEDRLMFGGNTSQPDTIWGSVTGLYDDMTAGANDADAVIFTLSSRQVNVIEWMVGKDKLLIGTSGAEWTIAGGTDEPLSPSNVVAKQHSTYGSANLQANLANESVLFFQRGAEKMRELAYNWELDSYVAPDMTILANLVTNTGITDTAFQRTPNSILWTTRTDGEMPIFSYERAEGITAWSRMITHTNLAGTLTDSDIESVAVINGSPEDEVWVIVERTIGGSTVRYIEQFQPRDFGDSTDAIFVDACVTYDSTASSAMTGLTHLIGQTVYVLADGVEFDTEIVDGSGNITLSLGGVTTTASTVQMGLGYEVQLRTMPLSWLGGQTIQGKQKKISEVISRWYKSGDFSIGKDADNLQTYSITNQTTDIDRKTFPAGWDRNAYIFVYQLSPEPLTLLSIMTEFNLK